MMMVPLRWQLKSATNAASFASLRSLALNNTDLSCSIIYSHFTAFHSPVLRNGLKSDYAASSILSSPSISHANSAVHKQYYYHPPQTMNHIRGSWITSRQTFLASHSIRLRRLILLRPLMWWGKKWIPHPIPLRTSEWGCACWRPR